MKALREHPDMMKLTMASLIGKVEADIRFDPASLPQKLSRSHATEELIRRGRVSISSIILNVEFQLEYASDQIQGVLEDVLIGWMSILNWIGNYHGFGQDTPVNYLDIQEWLAWARKHAI